MFINTSAISSLAKISDLAKSKFKMAKTNCVLGGFLVATFQRFFLRHIFLYLGSSM
jgi:hypothetical protein